MSENVSPGVYDVDLHAHTRFFHGHRELGDRYDPLGVRLLALAARARGLDAVVTTNHDYYTEFPTHIAGVVVLPGIEISTARGHILVIGPDPPAETEPGDLGPARAVEMAHERDCAAIIAHPYRNSTVREVTADYDAIEVNGKHPRTREWVEHLADRFDLPMTGGSDAHYPVEVGRAHTQIEADDLTPESVVRAIREGRIEPQVSNSVDSRLLRRLYRRIHEGKSQLDAPDWATPGVGAPPEDD